MPTVATVDDLLRLVGSAEPPLCIFGGVAEDAVLDGAMTRPHLDLDVMIPRHDLDMRLAQFGEWGYEEWDVWQADSRGAPQVLHSHGHPVEFEVSLLDGHPGEYYFEFQDPSGGYVHFFPPPDLFSAAPVTIDGIAVRTVTPETLFVIRQALIDIGSFGPPREKDVAVHPRLRALFDDAPRPRISRAP